MRKLRRKIVLAAFASTAVIFLLTIIVIGSVLHFQMIRRADLMTEVIDEYGDAIPSKETLAKSKSAVNLYLYDFDEETRYKMRYFTVSYRDGEAIADTSHITISSDDAIDIADHILLDFSSTGYYQDYRYRVSEKTNSVIALDWSAELESLRAMMLMISLIAVLFVIAITILFYFFSKRVVRPFEENAKMQKQFITDASHELKTPLAIISANAEVLAYKDGENEWISNITEQVERIGGLINELLTLNRLEEIDQNIDIRSVDLSKIAENTCADFEEVFKAKNAAVTKEIDDNVVINANPDQMKRLFSVLVENAAKYVSESGAFTLRLKKDLRHTTLSVFNTCEIDPSVDYKLLFDRFYRPDLSRTSQTGGHGIGLSIAKRIAVLHNGNIEAIPRDDGLTFNVTLSNRLKADKKEIS
ncbi:MAG: hypothetical protein IJH32_09930 [Ruminococcus sp.]|nr:hypothetical protein [Ruminococcus sp.]